MATTIVPQYDLLPVDASVSEIRDAAQELLESARGDEDKADNIEDNIFYEGGAWYLEALLQWMTGSQSNPTQEMNSMAEKKTMDTIEKTIDVAADTVDTLERIPTARLNGTTKNQQVLILTTVGTVGIVAGVMITRTINSVKAKIQARRNHKTIENFAAGKDVS